MRLIEKIARGLTTIEDADVVLGLTLVVERLVDVMERSDLAEFEDAEPVSFEEWLGAIEAAKEALHAAR